MAFNQSMCANELAKVASLLLHRDDCSSEDAIMAIEKLLVRIGIRTRLRDLGLRESDIPTVVTKTLSIERLLAVNARRPNAEDLEHILRRAF
jgi:alcohol dehydrogenase class IV